MAEMKGYEILTSSYFDKEVDVNDMEAVEKKIVEWASTPSPHNIWQIGQLVGYTVENILSTKLNWLESISDMKNGAVGDKPEFEIPYTGVKAKIQAKGGTPEISMIYDKKTVIATYEVSARPKINFQELVQNPKKIMRIIDEAVLRMENAMVVDIETTLYTAFSALSAPNYASGAGVSTTIFDPLLQMVQRFGGATIFGDVVQLQQFTALTGYSNRVAEKYMVEGNENRFIGIYKGANLVELTNRYVDESSLAESNLVLRDDIVYVLPTGSKTSNPLKVFVGGTMRSMEAKHIEDESYEIAMRMEFGAAVIGHQKRMAMFEDTNE